MKSQHAETWLDAVLFEYALEHLEWPETEAEIDRVLDETSSTDQYSESETAKRVQSVEGQATPKTAAIESLPSLFEGLTANLEAKGRKVCNNLYDIVVRAYVETTRKFSIDRMIADPGQYALFVASCWRMGAVASQCELGLALLAARKKCRIGRIAGVSKFSIPRVKLDQYLFASEFALRNLEDEEFFEHQRFVSLDRVLCDPTLGRRFEDFARLVQPGYSSLEYRWAALTLRKSLNRAPTRTDLVIPRFDLVGRGEDVARRRISDKAGFVWVRFNNTDLYIGHGERLREFVERLLEADLTGRQEWLGGRRLRQAEFACAECPGLSASNREPLKGLLVGRIAPRMNLLERKSAI